MGLSGLLDAYNPDLRAIDLRNNFSPLVLDIVNILETGLGLPGACEFLPLEGCPTAAAQAAGSATPADIDEPRTPLRSLLTLLASDASGMGEGS